MSKFFISSALSIFLMGCGSFPIKTERDWEADLFRESVQKPLSKEFAGEPAGSYGKESWAKYWIWRCELLNYESTDEGIDYVIQQRRKKGLPEIPQINTRSFRTPWQIFTSSQDPVIERETKGLPPPQFTGKTWRDHWQSQFKSLRLNKKIGERGIAYIQQRRNEMHLPPIKERPSWLP